MNTYRFSIIIEQDEHGYFVRCLELWGRYSKSDTYEEVMKSIKDAIKVYLRAQCRLIVDRIRSFP